MNSASLISLHRVSKDFRSYFPKSYLNDDLRRYTVISLIQKNIASIIAQDAKISLPNHVRVTYTDHFGSSVEWGITSKNNLAFTSASAPPKVSRLN